MDSNAVIIDNIKWWIRVDNLGTRHPQPVCPTHNLRLVPVKGSYERYLSEATSLKCEDCKNWHKIPRGYDKELQYVVDKIDAKIFKNMKFINIDDEAIPLAESKISSEDSKFFVTSLLIKSKVGLRLVVYAGEKGKKEKTQIFVEPEIKRLAFDQKDMHPTDVFTKLEATFSDRTKAEIRKAGEEDGK